MYAPSKVLKTAERNRKCSHHSDGEKSWMEARSGGESSKGRAKEAEAQRVLKDSQPSAITSNLKLRK